jgi:hypothetical protein
MGCLAAVYINNQYRLILSMLVFQGVVKFDAVCRGAIQHISLTKNEGVGEGHPAEDILLARPLGMANAL